MHIRLIVSMYLVDVCCICLCIIRFLSVGILFGISVHTFVIFQTVSSVCMVMFRDQPKKMETIKSRATAKMLPE
jgi:hypothetical protein